MSPRLARQPRQLGVGERTGGGRVGTFGELGGALRVAACAGPVAQAIGKQRLRCRRRCAQRVVVERLGEPGLLVDRRAVAGAVGDQVGDIDLSTDRLPAAKRVAQLRHGEHALQVGPGGLVRVTRLGRRRGALVPVEGADLVAGPLVVLGRDRQVLGLAVADPRRQPGGGAGVRLAPVGLEHRVVGHLMQEVVLERRFAGAGERALHSCLHHRLLLERAQHRRRVRIEGVQRVVPEHRADDAGELHRAPLGGAERVEPRLQHPGQGAGNAGDAQPLVEHAPALALDQDHAVVDQHLDQLFGIEGVAFGLLLDQRAQGRRGLGQALQHGAGERLALLGAECGQSSRSHA